MRLSLRFVVPLTIALSLIALGVVPLADSFTFKWFVRDVDMRSRLVARTIEDALAPLVAARWAEPHRGPRIERLFNRLIQDERLYAIGFCDLRGQLLYPTPTFPREQVTCEILAPGEDHRSRVMQLPQGPLHVAYFPLRDPAPNPPALAGPTEARGEILGEVVVIHDLSFTLRRSADTRTYIVYFFGALGAVIALLTVIIAELSLKGWIRSLRETMRGKGLLNLLSQPVDPMLEPVMRDLRGLVRRFEGDRHEKDESKISWSPEALRDILQKQLRGDEVLTVSNREPYIHVRKGDRIEIQSPASGLVTALEPIMRACSGTWIAHGGGSADRETVDRHDRVRVPPDNPSYQIRRVWLTPEEEKGYYYGFANEGLWALCHIAHVRPVFRSQDWEQYVAVNQKFADAVVEEAKTDDPVVLVQDYHFALLPKMIRTRLPKATVITFWHIPFPNSEVFGICPWREEILDGLLGSSILGFHTRFHCNNFMDAANRFIESRVDRDTNTISYRRSLTAVNHYPISIEHPAKWTGRLEGAAACRAKIRAREGLPAAQRMGIGLDRLDYTKGILERFLAVERLFELHPQWIGQFSFVQIAAPSRSSIGSYQHFETEVVALAARINGRFGRPGYQPILLKIEHHGPDQVYEYYRGSDLCFVSSLHDGMNLVSKEFVAAREDGAGVLVLSQFAGAARELPEALIVNPYDIDQCAHALHIALEMPVEEQRERMRSMRGYIQEFNVFRWAGRMLLDAARLRKRTRLFDQIREAGERRPGTNEA